MRKSKPERIKNSRNNRGRRNVEVQLTAIRVGVEISAILEEKPIPDLEITDKIKPTQFWQKDRKYKN